MKKRVYIGLLLISLPFLLLLWTAWYSHTYFATSASSNNQALRSLTALNICDRNIFNDHIPLCAEIDNYCRSPKGQQNHNCPVWLQADQPFRYYFWVSSALGLIVFIAGCALLTLGYRDFYSNRLQS